MKKICVLSCLILGVFLFSSCVHEFPQSLPNEVTLTLAFETDLNFYKEYTVETRSDNNDGYRQRYVVKGYEINEDGTVSGDASFTKVWFGEDIRYPDYTVSFEIPSGHWRLAAWSDIVPAGAEVGYYDASSFTSVTYRGHYTGSTDQRDAFCGTADLVAEAEEFEDNRYDVTITMTRPLAKYVFISTDLDEFIRHYVGPGSAEETRTGNVDLSQFKVMFYYSGYMPDTYNVLTETPVDSSTGMRFQSSMTPLEDGTVSLGFDYTMVRSTESSVQVCLGVFDRDGNQLAMTPGIEVPLMQGRYTIVKGKFLFADSSSGISVNTDFDGDYNIIID